MKRKKIIGLVCGRVDGNGEILLKEALMAADELGIGSEIIHAMELRVKPCRGCESCTAAMSKGLEPKCVIKDDDVKWILEKVLLEGDALILSAPVYHLRPNGYFMCISERMLPIMLRNQNILNKTRVGGLISVGGGDWTAPALAMLNIFLQHSFVLVDQIQIQFATQPGSVLKIPGAIDRAKLLGIRIAEAMTQPIEKARYLGEDTPASCPVCHCNVLHIPGKLSEVICPVCEVRGTVVSKGDESGIIWNSEDIKYPRFSEKGVKKHVGGIRGLHQKFWQNDREDCINLMKKYKEYGNIIRP
ncbi:MAG: flavodoxin family protein [Dehalococcoidales bacterium]|nr:flavodoxin family protein [Dehalococcoidales bacterium]